MIADCAIAFAGGAFSEAACLWWVAASERGRPALAAAFSMLYALAISNGIGEAIHTLPGEVSFVAGFGFGTYAAVQVKTWWLKRRTDRRALRAVRDERVRASEVALNETRGVKDR